MISFKSNVFYDKVYGRCLEIKTNKDIFKKINDTKELKDAAYKLILNGNKKFQTITDKIDNKEIKFARISAKEYVYGRNSQKLKEELYVQKMRMAPSIDDLINNASITYYSPLKHRKDIFKSGYNNYQGQLVIDNNIFSYIVRVGKAKNDNIFYDISLELLGQKIEPIAKYLKPFKVLHSNQVLLKELDFNARVNFPDIANSLYIGSITFYNINVNIYQ